MLTHDIIKIKYSDEGYLENYPPHLISDDEMFDAFFNNPVNFFSMNYPLSCESLREAYELLKQSIKCHICLYRNSGITIPDWVYSYMLGSVIGPRSSQRDIHDLLVLLNCDNFDDVYGEQAQANCYKISETYINKLNYDSRYMTFEDDKFDGKFEHYKDKKYTISLRPPTMFGEPHVIKQLKFLGVS